MSRVLTSHTRVFGHYAGSQLRVRFIHISGTVIHMPGIFIHIPGIFIHISSEFLFTSLRNPYPLMSENLPETFGAYRSPPQPGLTQRYIAKNRLLTLA